MSYAILLALMLLAAPFTAEAQDRCWYDGREMGVKCKPGWVWYDGREWQADRRPDESAPKPKAKGSK